MLRHADPDRDGAACAAIYEPHVLAGMATFEVQPPSGGDMASRIVAISRTHPWLVAERDGAVAGYAYASPHRDRPGYRWAADVAIYVDAGRQRGGVGRELYEGLLPLLSRQRLHVACAGIALPNDASVALHRAIGFEPVGVYHAIGFKRGRWLDVGWWQARLRPAREGEPPAEPLAPQRL